LDLQARTNHVQSLGEQISCFADLNAPNTQAIDFNQSEAVLLTPAANAMHDATRDTRDIQ